MSSAKDLDFTRTHHRKPAQPVNAPVVGRIACVVCGLRADVLVCKECANTPEASIRWLETLPGSERIQTALELLRAL